MAFLDSFKEIAGNVGSTVKKGVKTGSDNIQKMTEKNRLKREIGQLEAEINTIYSDIGRKVFNDNPNAPEYSDSFMEIREKSAKAESLRQQLASLDDKSTCPSCGQPIAKDARFCDKCGAKIESAPQPESADPQDPAPQPETQQPASGKVCCNCGAPMAEGDIFCEKCGAKNN